MDAPVRVSVIMAAYNAAGTIEKSIQSVRAQSMPDWELLIIDDGSKDETLAISQAWAARDPRIRALTKPNGGASSARNLGLREACGEWILFHDADDWTSPEQFARSLAVAAEKPDVDVVVSDFQSVTDDGEPLRVYRHADLTDFFSSSVRTCPVWTCATLFRRKLYERIGPFDEKLRTSEDWDFWQRLARTGARVAGIGEPLAFYRMRPGSLTRGAASKVLDGLTVIDRGFAPDPRVRDPHPAYAQGLPPGERDDMAAYCTIYVAAVGIGLGQDPMDVLQHAPDLSSWAMDASMWAPALTDAIAYGLAIPESDLKPLWPKIAPQLDRFCAALRSRAGDCRMIDLLRAHVEARILGADAFSESRGAGRVVGRAIDLAAPLQDVDLQGAEALVVALHCHGAFVTVLELPGAGGVSAHELRRAIIASAGAWPAKDSVLALGAWKRPTFLAGVIRAGLSARSWRALRAPHLSAKARIRQVIGGALLETLRRQANALTPAAPAGGLTDALAAILPPQSENIPRVEVTNLAPMAPMLFFRAVGAGGAEGLARHRVAPVALLAQAQALQKAGRRIVALRAFADAMARRAALAGAVATLNLDGAGVSPDDPIFELAARAGAPLTLFVGLEGTAPADGWTWRALQALAAMGHDVGYRMRAAPPASRMGLLDLAQGLKAAHAAFSAGGFARPPVLFALGDCDSITRNLSARAGFAAGLHPHRGFAHIDGDPMVLWRIPVYAQDDVDSFLRKATPP